MPVAVTISVSGHDIVPDTFKLNFNRQTAIAGYPTTEPSWGSLSFSLGVEMESDSDTFWAAWMSAPYQTYTVDVAFHNTLSNQTFLNIKMENAVCIAYGIDSTGYPSLENPAETNGSFRVTIAAPTVKVGQATIGVKPA